MHLVINPPYNETYVMYHRRTFTLSAGIVSQATLCINGIGGVAALINGIHVGGTNAALSINPQLFVPGGTNVLAVQVAATSNLTAISLTYRLEIS